MWDLALSHSKSPNSVKSSSAKGHEDSQVWIMALKVTRLSEVAEKLLIWRWHDAALNHMTPLNFNMELS